MIIMAMVIGGLLLVTIALLIAVLVMCCRNRAYALGMKSGSMKSYKVRRSDVSNINYINEQTVVLNRSDGKKPINHHDESSSVVNPETTTTYHYSSSRSKNSSSLYPNSTSRFDSFLSRNDSSALESSRVPPTRFESTGILGQNGQKRISNGSSRGSRASYGSRGSRGLRSRSSKSALKSFLPFGGHNNELGRLPSDESPIAPHRRLMTSEWAHVDEVIDARRTPKLTRLSNISKMSHLQSPHVTRNVRSQNAPILNGNRPKLSSQSFNPSSRQQIQYKQNGDHVTSNDPSSQFGQRRLRGQQSLNPNAYRSIQFNNFGPITAQNVQISPSQYASVSDRLPSLPLPLEKCQPKPTMTHQSPMTHHSPMMQPIIDDEGSRHSYHSLFIPHSEQSTVV